VDVVVPGLHSVPSHSEVQAVRFRKNRPAGAAVCAGTRTDCHRMVSSPREAADSAGALAGRRRSDVEKVVVVAGPRFARAV
jgi:hypothetical protein